MTSADRKALLGVARCSEPATRPTVFVPNCCRSCVPAVDAAGHRPAQRPDRGDFVESACRRRSRAWPQRRAAAGIKAVQLLGLGVPHDGEQIAANAAATSAPSGPWRHWSAMAASMALPPCFSTSSPICAASGWLVATMPCGAIVTDRPALPAPRQSLTRLRHRAHQTTNLPSSGQETSFSTASSTSHMHVRRLRRYQCKAPLGGQKKRMAFGGVWAEV